LISPSVDSPLPSRLRIRLFLLVTTKAMSFAALSDRFSRNCVAVALAYAALTLHCGISARMLPFSSRRCRRIRCGFARIRISASVRIRLLPMTRIVRSRRYLSIRSRTVWPRARIRSLLCRRVPRTCCARIGVGRGRCALRSITALDRNGARVDVYSGETSMVTRSFFRKKSTDCL